MEVAKDIAMFLLFLGVCAWIIRSNATTAERADAPSGSAEPDQKLCNLAADVRKLVYINYGLLVGIAALLFLK